MLDVYMKQVRSILELAVSAWHGAITQAERDEIERVQKAALHIEKYTSYRNALKQSKLQSLESRRDKLCLKFAKKAEKDPKHRQWFKKTQGSKTRQNPTKYYKVLAHHDRYKKSPISHLTRLLNKEK